MKSPICEVCGKDFRSEYLHTGNGGVCLDFADYIELPEDAVGHPFGSGWFCAEHCVEAKTLLSGKFAHAIDIIRKRHSIDEADLPKEYPNVTDPELWITDVGQNRNRVFSIIRKAMNVSPLEAKDLLSSGAFKLYSGWPTSFAEYKDELEECGAKVEVRYGT